MLAIEHAERLHWLFLSGFILDDYDVIVRSCESNVKQIDASSLVRVSHTLKTEKATSAPVVQVQTAAPERVSCKIRRSPKRTAMSV